jgi:hypothetical protein
LPPRFLSPLEGRERIHDEELMWIVEEAGCDNPKRIRRKARALAGAEHE